MKTIVLVSSNGTIMTRGMIIKRNNEIIKGVIISDRVLEMAHIHENDVRIEVFDREIHIVPHLIPGKKKFLSQNSPLMKFVGITDVNGVSGRDHDTCLYSEAD